MASRRKAQQSSWAWHFANSPREVYELLTTNGIESAADLAAFTNNEFDSELVAAVENEGSVKALKGLCTTARRCFEQRLAEAGSIPLPLILAPSSAAPSAPTPAKHQNSQPGFVVRAVTL